MSPHAPPHLKDIAPLLMAGEDVRFMAKPNMGVLALLEVIVAAGSFVVLWILFNVFSDLPVFYKTVFAGIAAILGVVILHFTVGMRKYVITDQRVLVVTPFAKDVHDSCELDDIAAVTSPRFTRSLIVQRRHGKPIRLWALADISGALSAMNIAELGEVAPPQQQTSEEQ